MWALAYAEALDAFGQADRAWSIRRQAWLEISKRRATLRASTSAKTSLQDDDKQAELRARSITLAQNFAGGDFSRNLLLGVLRQQAKKFQHQPSATEPAMARLNLTLATDDAALATNTATSVYTEVSTADAALAWSLSNEPYELANVPGMPDIAIAGVR